MHTKKHLLRVSVALCIAIFLVSLCLLCFGRISTHKVFAEEPISSTVDSAVSEEEVSEVSEIPVVPEVEVTTEADEFNDSVKEYGGLIFGAINTLLLAALLAITCHKKKEAVTVVVNDEETKTKLGAIQTENTNLRNMIVDIFKLEEGTFDVLRTLFAENSSLDQNVRNVIKEISVHKDTIIKDFSDILNAENHKKVKTTLNNISNIILG